MVTRRRHPRRSRTAGSDAAEAKRHVALARLRMRDSAFRLDAKIGSSDGMERVAPSAARPFSFRLTAARIRSARGPRALPVGVPGLSAARLSQHRHRRPAAGAGGRGGRRSARARGAQRPQRRRARRRARPARRGAEGSPGGGARRQPRRGRADALDDRGDQRRPRRPWARRGGRGADQRRGAPWTARPAGHAPAPRSNGAPGPARRGCRRGRSAHEADRRLPRLLDARPDRPRPRS